MSGADSGPRSRWQQLLRGVPPVGSNTSQAIVCGGGRGRVMDVTVPVYPVSAQGARLREERLARREGLRECAKRLGLRASELCDLETGRATLPTERDWSECLLAAAADWREAQ